MHKVSLIFTDISIGWKFYFAASGIWNEFWDKFQIKIWFERGTGQVKHHPQTFSKKSWDF